MEFDSVGEFDIVTVGGAGDLPGSGPVAAAAVRLIGPSLKGAKEVSLASEQYELDLSGEGDVVIGVYSRSAGSHRPTEKIVGAVLRAAGDDVGEIRLEGAVGGDEPAKSAEEAEKRVKELVVDLIQKGERPTVAIWAPGVRNPGYEKPLYIIGKPGPGPPDPPPDPD